MGSSSTNLKQFSGFTVIGDFKGHTPPLLLKNEVWNKNLMKTLKYNYIIGIAKPSTFNTLTCHF